MPLKTHDWWKHRIIEIKGINPDWGEIKLSNELEKIYKSGDFPREAGAPPVQRTIGRIIKREWEPLSEQEKTLYRYFSWPESMERGQLPWEASSYALELVSHWRYSPAPTVRMALWYWRVSLAAPDAPAVTRFGIAELLASAETIKKYPDKLTKDKMQEVNPKVMLFLSLTPWRSPSHEARYRGAALSAGYEPYPIDFACDLFKRIDGS